MRNLASESQLLWCIIGDFNDMMYAHEKQGGRRHEQVLLEGFKKVVYDSGLCDLGFLGSEFTWERSRGKSIWVRKGLIGVWQLRSGEICFPKLLLKF